MHHVVRRAEGGLRDGRHVPWSSTRSSLVHFQYFEKLQVQLCDKIPPVGADFKVQQREEGGKLLYGSKQAIGEGFFRGSCLAGLALQGHFVVQIPTTSTPTPRS